MKNNILSRNSLIQFIVSSYENHMVRSTFFSFFDVLLFNQISSNVTKSSKTFSKEDDFLWHHQITTLRNRPCLFLGAKGKPQQKLRGGGWRVSLKLVFDKKKLDGH